MKKSTKIIIIASTVIELLAVAGIYCRYSQLQDKKAYFQAKFVKAQVVLPDAIYIDSSSSSGVFSTNLVHTVHVQEKGAKSFSKLVVKTHIKHGLPYLLTGIIDGASIGVIEGPITKYFDGLKNDQIFNSNITVSSNDTVIVKTKFNDFSLDNGTQVKGSSSYFESHRNQDAIKTDLKIGSIVSPKGADGKSLLSVKGIDVDYSGKLNKIDDNDFSLKVSEIDSPFSTINALAFNTKSSVKAGDIEFTSSLQAGKINAGKWDNGSAKFKFTVAGLSSSAVKSIYSIAQKSSYSDPDQIRQSTIEMKDQVQNIFTNGLSFKIDKLAIKSGNDNFDFSFEAVLPKAKSFKEQNLEENLYLSYKLESKGSFAAVLADGINSNLNLLTPDSPKKHVSVKNNLLTVNLDISNAHGTLNGKEFDKDQDEIIHIILSTLDKNIHGDTNASIYSSINDARNEKLNGNRVAPESGPAMGLKLDSNLESKVKGVEFSVKPLGKGLKDGVVPLEKEPISLASPVFRE